MSHHTLYTYVIPFRIHIHCDYIFCGYTRRCITYKAIKYLVWSYYYLYFIHRAHYSWFCRILCCGCRLRSMCLFTHQTQKNEYVYWNSTVKLQCDKIRPTKTITFIYLIWLLCQFKCGISLYCAPQWTRLFIHVIIARRNNNINNNWMRK